MDDNYGHDDYDPRSDALLEPDDGIDASTFAALLDLPCPVRRRDRCERRERVREHVALVTAGHAYDIDDAHELLVALGIIPDPIQAPTGVRDAYGKSIQRRRKPAHHH